MNTVSASTYLYLLKFLSSVSYNFLSTGILLPWLNLFLGMFFNPILNGTVFLVSLSDSSWLAYKNATDFWILILYTATLLNSLISSSSFLVESLGFPMYNIRSSANNDSFTSSFPIWMPFISSPCLIAVVSFMLNKRGERRHSSLSCSSS